MNDLTTRETKELRALQTRRSRDRTGRFVAEGLRLVEDLLASPIRPVWAAVASSLGDSERGARLIESLATRRVPTRTLPDPEFALVAGTDAPQGVLAVAEAPQPSLEAALRAPDPAVVLVLDAVQDPGNFGTLIRSAEALGAVAALALPGTVDPWNPKAVRAAMGSSFRLPIVVAPWSEAGPRLRQAGFRLLVAAGGGDPLRAAPPRAALVVGNEGAGVSPELLHDADQVVGIPLRGRAESLNVAAAAAILLYELTR